MGKTAQSDKKLSIAEFSKRLRSLEPVSVEIDAAEILREEREARAGYLVALVTQSLKNQKARPE